MACLQSEASVRQRVLAAGISQGRLHCVLTNDEYLEVQIIELSDAGPFVSERNAISIKDKLQVVVPIICAAFNDSGQLALGVRCSDTAKVFLLNQSLSTIKSYNVESSSATKNSLKAPQVVWLSRTSLLTSLELDVRIWSLPYMTCQAHAILPISSRTLTSIATTSRSKNAKDMVVVVQRENSLYICRSTVSRSNNLLESIGKKHTSSLLANSWLQDISLQSTWKNTGDSVDTNAEACLHDLESVKSGREFDRLLGNYLKVDLAESEETQETNERYIKDSRPPNRTNLARDKHQVIMSEQTQTSAKDHQYPAEGERSPLSEALPSSRRTVPGVQSETESTKLDLELAEEIRSAFPHRKHQSPQSDAAKLLSTTFVERLIGLVFLEFPTRLPEEIASGTIRYLFGKRLVRLPEGEQADKILDFMVQHKSPLRTNLMQPSVELLPKQLLVLLKSFFGEDGTFEKALSSILPALADFDSKLVHTALSSVLAPSEISVVLQILQNDLKSRVADPLGADRLSVSEDVLCTSITRFLDAFGYSNVVLSSTSSRDVEALKQCTASLVRETEQVDATASHIAQFLMKCRAQDMVKANNKSRAKGVVQQTDVTIASNKLEKLKDSTEGMSGRARAYARVVGVGSAYTIETIQI